MAREFADTPLYWQDKAPSHIQDAIRRRRYRYVLGSEALEKDGFTPVTQVTLSSGRLLRRGDPMVQYMVEASVRQEEEERIRRHVRAQELEFRMVKGSVVPLVAPETVKLPTDFRASRTGITLFVREMQSTPWTLEEVAEKAQFILDILARASIAEAVTP